MALTTRQQLRQYMAQYGAVVPYANQEGSGVISTPGLGVSCTIFFGDEGTTLPGTLEGLTGMDSSSWSWSGVSEKMISFLAMMNAETTGTIALGWLYKFGTVDLNGTGDKFTHDAATFPVRRTVMGVTADVPLLPIFYCTTAANGSGTAYTLKTAAGGTGYFDEANNAVVGTRSTTISAINSQTTWVSALEVGDCSMLDLAAVQITAGTATAGALACFGFEPMFWTPGHHGRITGLTDVAFGQMGMQDFKPAAATSGTVTAYFVAVQKGTTPAQRGSGFFAGFPNV